MARYVVGTTDVPMVGRRMSEQAVNEYAQRLSEAIRAAWTSDNVEVSVASGWDPTRRVYDVQVRVGCRLAEVMQQAVEAAGPGGPGIGDVSASVEWSGVTNRPTWATVSAS